MHRAEGELHGAEGVLGLRVVGLVGVEAQREEEEALAHALARRAGGEPEAAVRARPEEARMPPRRVR